MQKLFSMFVAGSLVSASALPALACGGGGGGCGMGGGYGYGGGRAVAYGKVAGRAPMLAEARPRAGTSVTRGPAVANKQAAAPNVHTVAAPKKK
jgi:hypothetical protein